MKKGDSKKKTFTKLRKKAEKKLKPIDNEDLKVDFIIKKPFDLSELTKRINDVMSVGSR